MQFRKSIIPPFCCPALQTGPGLDIILMYPGTLPAFRKIRWGGSWFILNFDMSILFFLTELAGTVAFSISGAILAIERELDLFGVIFLGAVTAIGGGVVRDLLLGQIPPQAFLNYIYLLTAVLTALLVFLLSWLYQWICTGIWDIHLETNYLLLLFLTPVASLVSMLGDLSASLVKRQCGVKDYGSLMPGHGGIVDRFDSVFFVAPLLFLFIRLFPIV